MQIKPNEVAFYYLVYVEYNRNIVRGRILYSIMPVIFRNKVSTSADDK